MSARNLRLIDYNLKPFSELSQSAYMAWQDASYQTLDKYGKLSLASNTPEGTVFLLIIKSIIAFVLRSTGGLYVMPVKFAQ